VVVVVRQSPSSKSSRSVEEEEQRAVGHSRPSHIGVQNARQHLDVISVKAIIGQLTVLVFGVNHIDFQKSMCSTVAFSAGNEATQ